MITIVCQLGLALEEHIRHGLQFGKAQRKALIEVEPLFLQEKVGIGLLEKLDVVLEDAIAVTKLVRIVGRAVIAMIESGERK